MEYLDIFPTRIWKFRLNIDKEQLLQNINEIRKTDGNGVNKSAYGGWQSNRNVLERIPHLKNKILESFQEIITNDDLNIKDSWININKKGNMNLPHIHPGSMLSCAYFVKLPIPFQKSILFFNLYGTPNFPDTFCPAIEEDQLYIFSSNLSHMVLPNISDEERITISCNYG